MSTWLSWAKAAPGVMVELYERKTTPWCVFNGHTPQWRSDVLACRFCPHTFKEATDAILEGLSTAEGMAMVIDEMKRRAA